MKKCPVCEMTVKADSTCPICQSTITYEPEVKGRFEKKKLNSYLGFYLLKRFAFVLGAILFCVIAGLFIQKTEFWYLTAVTGAAALVIASLERTLTMYIKIKFFEVIMWIFIIAIKYVALLMPVIWGTLHLFFNR